MKTIFLLVGLVVLTLLLPPRYDPAFWLKKWTEQPKPPRRRPPHYYC